MNREVVLRHGRIVPVDNRQATHRWTLPQYTGIRIPDGYALPTHLTLLGYLGLVLRP